MGYDHGDCIICFLQGRSEVIVENGIECDVCAECLEKAYKSKSWEWCDPLITRVIYQIKDRIEKVPGDCFMCNQKKDDTLQRNGL